MCVFGLWHRRFICFKFVCNFCGHVPYLEALNYALFWLSVCLQRALKSFGSFNDRILEIVERAIPGYSSMLEEYAREAAARKQRREKEKMARDLSKCVSELSTRPGQYFPPE